MKAILICQHGDLDQINFQEIDCQEVRVGYVLVKMKAAALNHLDLAKDTQRTIIQTIVQ